MSNRATLVLGAIVFGTVAVGCSHSGSSTVEGASGEASVSGSYGGDTPIKSEDPPEDGYSCHHYSPTTNTIYTGAGSAERLESGPSDAFRREYVERMFHGVYQAKGWGERVDTYRSNHDVGDATRREIVDRIRRDRMREAGSVEAYVRMRLQEEMAAKREAWEAANEHPQFDLPDTPVAEAELTDEEIARHRRVTEQYVQSLQENEGELFE